MGPAVLNHWEVKNRHLCNYETPLTIMTKLGGDLLYERVAISLKTGQATIVPSPSSDTVRIVFEEKFILDMHGMEETIRHTMGSHIKLVSQSAALTKFIIGIKCNSISIAAITMRVVMIVTLHQHGFPTRSILQKRQKIERRFKSQGRGEAVSYTHLTLPTIYSV